MEGGYAWESLWAAMELVRGDMGLERSYRRAMGCTRVRRKVWECHGDALELEGGFGRALVTALELKGGYE